MPIEPRPTYKQRIPPPITGIQVNFCKNPKCPNFGIPALENIKGIKLSDAKATPARNAKRSRDFYTVGEAHGLHPRLKCHECGETPPIKSNLAIKQEFDRMWSYLEPDSGSSCPTSTCPNHGVPPGNGKQYHSFGTTKAGSARYRCRLCGKTFSVKKSSILRQRKSHENRLIFSMLVNKGVIKGILEVSELKAPALYNKIDFFQRQCNAFAAHYERRLPDMKIERLFISVDRQVYTVNWSNTHDKRNVDLQALGSADNRTGFVFATHLDFVPGLDPAEIEKDAEACGDYEKQHPFRQHARFWLAKDYEEDRQKSKKVKTLKEGPLVIKVADRYDEAAQRDNVETFVSHTSSTRLPAKGMQVHDTYTLYGHFLFLKHLLRNVGKIRFFLDQESGIRAACFAAFHEEIQEKRCDAFYVRISKQLTVPQRNASVAQGKKELDDFQYASNFPADLSYDSLRVLLIEERLEKGELIQFEPYKDKFLAYPAPSVNEPEKLVCYLTELERDPYSPFHLSKLYAKASLHGIDRYFMQLRRKLSLLERPISTSSNAGRRWFGYSPYRPDMVTKMLDIYRVYYNYVKVGQDKKTPAMRLGLTDRPAKINEILYFLP